MSHFHLQNWPIYWQYYQQPCNWTYIEANMIQKAHCICDRNIDHFEYLLFSYRQHMRGNKDLFRNWCYRWRLKYYYRLFDLQLLALSLGLISISGFLIGIHEGLFFKLLIAGIIRLFLVPKTSWISLLLVHNHLCFLLGLNWKKNLIYQYFYYCYNHKLIINIIKII